MTGTEQSRLFLPLKYQAMNPAKRPNAAGASDHLFAICMFICQEDLNNNITQEAAADKERNFFETDSWFSSKEVAGVRNR